jgi:hypothetical protein
LRRSQTQSQWKINQEAKRRLQGLLPERAAVLVVPVAPWVLVPEVAAAPEH